MPRTFLQELLEDFAEEYQQGYVGEVTASPLSTSWIDSSLIRATAGNEFGRNVPILLTASSAGSLGEERYLSEYNPNTGTITLTAAWSGGALNVGDDYIIAFPRGADSIHRWIEALNRFLRRVAKRMDKVALTQAGQAAAFEGPASLWDINNASVEYTRGTMVDYQLRRVLSVISSADNGYAQTDPWGVRPGERYTFFVPVVVPQGGAGDSAQVLIMDDSNGVEITDVTYDSGARTVTGESRQAVRGSFVVPTNCYLVRGRYNIPVTGTQADYGPFLVAREDAQELPVPVEIENVQQLGSLYEPRNLAGSEGGLAGISDDWTRRDDIGWHPVMRGFGTVVSAGQTLPFPCFIEAEIGYDELTLTDPDGDDFLSDATECSRDLALAGMAVEFFKQEHRKERLARGPDSAQTRWGGLLERAEQDLITAQSQFNAPKKITVRRHFAGRARA